MQNPTALARLTVEVGRIFFDGWHPDVVRAVLDACLEPVRRDLGSYAGFEVNEDSSTDFLEVTAYVERSDTTTTPAAVLDGITTERLEVVHGMVQAGVQRARSYLELARELARREVES